MRTLFPLKIERNEWDDSQQINEADKTTNFSLTTDGLALLHNFENPATSPTFNQKINQILKSNSDNGSGYPVDGNQ